MLSGVRDMAVGKNIKGITIEFAGDTTKLGKALRDVDSQTRTLDKDLNAVNRALKFNPGNTELLAQKQQLLGMKIGETKTRLDALRQAQARLDDDPAVDKTSQDYMQLRREIIETESKLKHFSQQMAQVKYENITRAGEAFKTAGAKARTAGIYISAAAAAGIMTGKKLIDLANAQAQAEAQLAEVYKSRQHATEDQTQATIDLAAALQKEGVYGDEVILSGAKQLATYTSTTKAVDDLLPAMTNLLAQNKGVNATQEDAAAMANLFGKALMGQTGALKRAGISFTAAQEEVLKYGTEEEKVAMLSEVVHDNVGDMNKALAETDAGKIQQAKNALGDFGERLGGMLLPHLASMANYLSEKIFPVIEKIFGYLESHPAIAKIAIVITGLMAVLGPLLIILGAVASGIGSIMTLAPMLGSVFAALAGPVGIAIAAIAALIAIGVALYKHWDQIKAAAAKVWQGIKDNIVKPVQNAVESVKKWFDHLKLAIGLRIFQLKTAVAEKFKAVKDAMLKPIRAARDAIKAIVEKIKGFFDFKAKIPKIKLPHFSITPKGWKLSDLLEGSIPSLGIEWYAKGGIFKSPSVIGVGEKGPEAVLPIDRLQEMMAAMADNIVNGMLTGMQLQAAGGNGEIKLVNYLYPSGPKMGEETVKMYDTYKRILG